MKDRPPVTIQQTSQRLKAHQLLSGAAVILGIYWMMQPADWQHSTGGWLTFGGLAWFIATRVRIWWNHG